MEIKKFSDFNINEAEEEVSDNKFKMIAPGKGLRELQKALDGAGEDPIEVTFKYGSGDETEVFKIDTEVLVKWRNVLKGKQILKTKRFGDE